LSFPVTGTMPSVLFRKTGKGGSEGETYSRKMAVYGHVAGGFPPVVTRAARARARHFPRSGFRGLCSSSISRAREPARPRLPPMHYLNKQAGTARGRLPRRLYTVSRLLSFSIINALLGSPSVFSFPLWPPALPTSLPPPPPLSLSLSLFLFPRARARLTKRYSDEQLSLPRGGAARKPIEVTDMGRSRGAGGGGEQRRLPAQEDPPAPCNEF
jgi:hypothetical protein